MKAGAFLALLLLAAPCSARADDGVLGSGVELDLTGYYEPESSSFPASTGGDATFKGQLVGGEAGVRVYSRQRRYGLAFLAGAGSRKAANNANTNGTEETLEGSNVHFAARFYVINLFFGLKLDYSPFSITYSSPTTPKTTTSYKAVGAGLALGMDLYLTQAIHITPKAEITSSAALPESGTAGSRRLTNYGLAIGLGLTL